MVRLGAIEVSRVLRTKKRMVAALCLFSAVLVSCSKQQEKSADVSPQKAADLMREGKFDQALDVLNIQIKEHPKDAFAYAWRADANIRSSQPDGKKAIADITKAIELDSKNSRFYQTRAMLSAQIGDMNDAVEDLGSMIKLLPRDAHAYEVRGAMLALRGDLASALADLNQAIKLNPNYSSAYSDRSFVYGLTSDYKNAIADANTAIELAKKQKLPLPLMANAYGNRARAYMGLGKYSDALNDANVVIKCFSTSSRDYDMRAEIYDKLNKPDLAKADRAKAAELRANPKQDWIQKQTYADIKSRASKKK